jgi:hypothetical protein
MAVTCVGCWPGFVCSISTVSATVFEEHSLSKAPMEESIQTATKGDPKLPSLVVQTQYKEDA